MTFCARVGEGAALLTADDFATTAVATEWTIARPATPRATDASPPERVLGCLKARKLVDTLNGSSVIGHFTRKHNSQDHTS